MFDVKIPCDVKIAIFDKFLCALHKDTCMSGCIRIVLKNYIFYKRKHIR